MTTFTVKGGDLAWLLSAVLPHVESEGMLPTLNGVLLEVTGEGYLTATGTDRYTLAHARVKLDEREDGYVPRGGLLRLAHLRPLLAVAKTEAKVRISLVIGEKSVTLACPALFGDDAGSTYAFPLNDAGAYPKWRPLIDDAARRGASNEPLQMGVNGNLLARFRLGMTERNEPLVMTVASPLRAAVFRSGDWNGDRSFVGLQMPIRLTDGLDLLPLGSWLGLEPPSVMAPTADVRAAAEAANA